MRYFWCVKWSFFWSHGPDFFGPGIRFFSDQESGIGGPKTVSEKVTFFGPLLLKSLYVDPDLGPKS